MAGPIHTNPHCRIWRLSSDTKEDSVHCSIANDSLYFLITLNDSDTVSLSSDNVRWMPWPIHSHGVDIKAGAHGKDVYVIELLKQSDDDEKNIFPSTTFSSRINTTVGTKLLAENNHVKIWEFRILPGRRCHLHRHVHDYLFINLVKSKTRGLDQKWQYATPSVAMQNAGQITHVSLQSEAIHAAENFGTETFHQVIVEFKNGL